MVSCHLGRETWKMVGGGKHVRFDMSAAGVLILAVI